ncbi:MAG: hypothetical protein EZS28_040069, partial [Streblomastix strix]
SVVAPQLDNGRMSRKDECIYLSRLVYLINVENRLKDDISVLSSIRKPKTLKV